MRSPSLWPFQYVTTYFDRITFELVIVWLIDRSLLYLPQQWENVFALSVSETAKQEVDNLIPLNQYHNLYLSALLSRLLESRSYAIPIPMSRLSARISSIASIILLVGVSIEKVLPHEFVFCDIDVGTDYDPFVIDDLRETQLLIIYTTERVHTFAMAVIPNIIIFSFASDGFLDGPKVELKIMSFCQFAEGLYSVAI